MELLKIENPIQKEISNLDSPNPNSEITEDESNTTNENNTNEQIDFNDIL